MAITYIGGATANTGGVAKTSLTVNYSPTAGNCIVVAFSTSSTTGGIVLRDNNAHSVTLKVGAIAARGINLYQSFAVAGATSYLITWGTSTQAVLEIAEYSGVDSSGQNGSVAVNTATITLAGANNYLVTAIDERTTGVTYTATVGNIRQQTNTTTCSCALGDNTAGSGDVTCTFTPSSGSAFGGAFLELLAAVVVPISGGMLTLGVSSPGAT